MRTDIELLAEAANFLEVTEFDVLRIANSNKLPPRSGYEEIEKLYGEIITNKKELPSWARGYLRLLVEACEEENIEEINELLQSSNESTR